MQHQLPRPSPPGGCYVAPQQVAVAAVAPAPPVVVAVLVAVFAMTLAAATLQW